MTEITEIVETKQRLPRLDALRGIAVVAMILYHFAWDLSFFKIIETNVANHPLWSRFAIIIASSFLILSGISLELSSRNGLDWDKFRKRLIILVGAAGIVSLGTFAATPTSFVYFGILHCIALSSLFALPFLRAPVVLTAITAVITFALPQIFTHETFSHPALLWTGLGTFIKQASDYVPIFPWFSAMLGGIVISKLMPIDSLKFNKGNAPILVKAGQKSLAIYLLHQPILMALVWAATFVLPLAGDKQAAQEFRISCKNSCQATGSKALTCATYCGCIEDRLKAQSLWKPLLRNRLTEEQEKVVDASVDASSKQCAEKAQ
jgi:uncharacterized membrane protein